MKFCCYILCLLKVEVCSKAQCLIPHTRSYTSGGHRISCCTFPAMPSILHSRRIISHPLVLFPLCTAVKSARTDEDKVKRLHWGCEKRSGPNKCQKNKEASLRLREESSVPSTTGQTCWYSSRTRWCIQPPHLCPPVVGQRRFCGAGVLDEEHDHSGTHRSVLQRLFDLCLSVFFFLSSV